MLPSTVICAFFLSAVPLLPLGNLYKLSNKLGYKLTVRPFRSLEMVLLPADLAASRVQEVILTTTIEKLCEKYGEDSPSVKAFRDERTALYTHIEKLEFLLSKSEDPMLKKEVELKTAAALKRYSDGLTMTKQELANRDKLEEEGFARRHLESKLFYEAERQRLRNLINK